MELTEAQWQTAIRHATAANFPGPGFRIAPNVVMLTLAALIGDLDQITASHTEYTLEGPSTWRTWAFTRSGLAHVEATFDAESYDAIEDRQRRQPRTVSKPPAEPKTLTSQMLPLRTASSFAVTRVCHHSGVGPIGGYYEDFTPLEIEIGFGGSSVSVGIETIFDDQAKRERWEDFIFAARQAVITGGAE
jgi:hypothetical protein